MTANHGTTTETAVVTAGGFRYPFVDTPGGDDFQRLADYVETADAEVTHPALHIQRAEVARGLRRMAGSPSDTPYQSAYQALRLFVC